MMQKQKWCVKRTPTNYKIINNIMGTSGDEGFIDNEGQTLLAVFNDHNILSFEQFVQKFGYTVEGYVCPMDLLEGRVKKGDIFSVVSSHGLVMYAPSYTTCGVPTELVKTWQPVVNTEIKVGDWAITTSETHKHLNKHEKGEVFQITKIWGEDIVYFGPQRSVSRARVRKATPEEVKEHLSCFEHILSFTTATDSTVVVKVTKGGNIEVEDNVIRIEPLLQLTHSLKACSNGVKCTNGYCYPSSFTSFCLKVGCLQLNMEQLLSITQAYESLKDGTKA